MHFKREKITWQIVLTKESNKMQLFYPFYRYWWEQQCIFFLIFFVKGIIILRLLLELECYVKVLVQPFCNITSVNKIVYNK